MTFPSFYGVVSPRCLKTPPWRTTPPDSMALFCALFAKSRFLLAAFWAIIASTDAGCPRYVQAARPKAGSSSKGCFQHPAFSIGENASVNLEKFTWSILCHSLSASTILLSPLSPVKINLGSVLQNLPVPWGILMTEKYLGCTIEIPMNSPQK